MYSYYFWRNAKIQMFMRRKLKICALIKKKKHSFIVTEDDSFISKWT
jgi:hypothetical protein